MQNQVQLIKLLKEKANVSQSELAVKVGTKSSRVSEYESNKHDISLNKFLKWCDILEVDTEELFKVADL